MSKEKQIEEMALELCRPRNIVKMIHHRTCGNCDTSSCDIYELCVDLYNAGYRKQSEWISVEERLPEGNLRCLVAYTGRHGYGEHEDDFIGITSACGGKFDMNEIYHFELDDIKIKYWMLLPEAPKMKGGAK